MRNLTADMSDEEIVEALRGVDSSDQWLAIENADEATKLRARQLWDLDAGGPRAAGDAGGGAEGGEAEGEERDPRELDRRPGAVVEAGEYAFMTGGETLFVYGPGEDPDNWLVLLANVEGHPDYSAGVIEFDGARWGVAQVTSLLPSDDEGGERDGGVEAEDIPDGPYRFVSRGGWLVVTPWYEPESPPVDHLDDPGFGEGAEGSIVRDGGQWGPPEVDVLNDEGEEIPAAPPVPGGESGVESEDEEN